jgi:lambda repressor-like predicted transcriptional regulator
MIDRGRITVMMERVGLSSINELAEASSIHPNTLSRVLSGSGWQSQTLVVLASVLGCHPFDLLVVSGFKDQSLGKSGEPLTVEYR